MSLILLNTFYFKSMLATFLWHIPGKKMVHSLQSYEYIYIFFFICGIKRDTSLKYEVQKM